MPYPYLKTDYTSMDVYFKSLPLQAHTDYHLEFDTLGGEMEVYLTGNIVRRIPEATSWTPCRLSIPIGKNPLAHLPDWGLCFVKTAWHCHQYSSILSDTYIDNVRLYSDADPTVNLLTGGDFERPQGDAIYHPHWRGILGSAGHTFGIRIVPDPFCPNNHCLLFPAVTQRLHYPAPLSVQLRRYSKLAQCDQEIHGIELQKAPCYHLLFVCHGTIQAEINGQHFTATDNTLLFIPAGSTYRYQCQSGEQTLYYHLEADGSSLPEILALLQLRCATVKPLHNSFSVAKQIEQLFRLSPAGNLNCYAANGLFLKLLADLENQFSLVDTSSRQYDAVIDNIASRLQRYPKKVVSNAHLAQEMGLSENYFINLFTARIGMSPQQYRIHALVQEASRLLCDTKLTVQEISFTLGINDPLYFSRIFRRVQGISPRDYRKQHQAAQ